MKNSKNDLEYLRHSTAHLLAAAVIKLWPDAKPTIGPAINEGFYYDFDFGSKKVSSDDLEKIETEMKNLVKDWKAFEKIEVDSKQARKFFAKNAYKIELIYRFMQRRSYRLPI